MVTEDFMALEVQIANEMGATSLLAGAGNIGMLPKRFPDTELNFIFQEFVHFVYKQIYNGWHPRLSVMDSLLTHGAEYTRKLIERGWIPE